VAMKMAEHGLLTAPNMAVGEPFNVGLTAATLTGAAAPWAGPLPGPLPGMPSADGVAGVPGGHGQVRPASP